MQWKTRERDDECVLGSRFWMNTLLKADVGYSAGTYWTCSMCQLQLKLKCGSKPELCAAAALWGWKIFLHFSSILFWVWVTRSLFTEQPNETELDQTGHPADADAH